MTKQKFLYQLGMCIRKYRQLAGMSQEKLGSVIHYDKNTIGKNRTRRNRSENIHFIKHFQRTKHFLF